MASACTNSLDSSGHEGPRRATRPTRAYACISHVEQRGRHGARLLEAILRTAGWSFTREECTHGVYTSLCGVTCPGPGAYPRHFHRTDRPSYHRSHKRACSGGDTLHPTVTATHWCVSRRGVTYPGGHHRYLRLYVLVKRYHRR